jgi:hypothetical protein
MPGESHLLLVCDFLVAEKNGAVIQQDLIDGAKAFGIQWLCEIDTENFRAKAAGKRTHIKGNLGSGRH